MERVIITGATSFIGLHLIDQLLLESSVEIIALVRPGSSRIGLLPDADRIKVLPIEMHTYHEIDSAIDQSCDTLFSLAWNGTRGVSRMNSELQRRNYEHSVAGLEAAVRLGCRLVITAGSQAEYGFHTSPISEDTDCVPNTEYGKFKLEYYYSVRDYCSQRGVKFREPRFFSLYGPGDYKNTMIISILRKMLRDEACLLTLGVQMWDFLYIDDAVRGIIRLAQNDISNGVYNFGSGRARQLKEYIQDMYDLTGSRSVLYYGAVPYPPTGMVSIEPNVEKLIKTGWYPEVTFRQGIVEVMKSLDYGKRT